MPNSVIEAIRMGIWDFEPKNKEFDEYSSTAALPGSAAKLDVLAERLTQGQPLWHPSDRRSYMDSDED